MLKRRSASLARFGTQAWPFLEFEIQLGKKCSSELAKLGTVVSQNTISAAEREETLQQVFLNGIIE